MRNRAGNAAWGFDGEFVRPAGRSGVNPSAQARPHGVARRDLEWGDVQLSWIRRTRFGGDSWEAPDAPLNEDRELYRLEILQASELRRSIELTSPAYLYLAADQQLDLGGQEPFTVRISQVSGAIGPGHPLEETVDV